MEKRSIRRTIARLTARRRRLRDLRRRAAWAEQARNTPTLERLLDTRPEPPRVPR
jgi:hypothetical protein